MARFKAAVRPYTNTSAEETSSLYPCCSILSKRSSFADDCDGLPTMTSYWQNKRVLVTGGAGFIGSYLVEQLVERGARIRVVDNLDRGRLNNLSSVLNDVEFVNADLRDREACL